MHSSSSSSSSESQAEHFDALAGELVLDLQSLAERGDQLAADGSSIAQQARQSLRVLTASCHPLRGLICGGFDSSDSTTSYVLHSGIANVETMSYTVADLRRAVEGLADDSSRLMESSGMSVLPTETRAQNAIGLSAAEIVRDRDPHSVYLQGTGELAYADNLETVRGYLSAIDPGLLDPIEGVRQALDVEQPDAIRRASQPARDLITLLLNALAPHEAVVHAAWYHQITNKEGQATRAQRVQFAVWGATCDDLDAVIIKAGSNLAKSLNSLYDDLSGSSHTGIGERSRIRVWYLQLLEHLRELFELRDLIASRRGA